MVFVGMNVRCVCTYREDRISHVHMNPHTRVVKSKMGTYRTVEKGGHASPVYNNMSVFIYYTYVLLHNSP